MAKTYRPNFNYSLRMMWERRRPMKRIRGFRWRMFSNANPGFVGRLRMAKAVVMWQVRLVGLGWKWWSDYSVDVARVHSVPRWVQLLRIYWAGAAHAIVPYDFYLYDLYKPENFRRIHEFLFDEDCAEVQYYLSKRYDSEFIANKALQAELYESASLPAIPTLGEAHDGKILGVDDIEHLAKEPALFVKPRDGGCGVGHELWTRNDDGTLSSNSGEELPLADFIKRLKDLSHETPYIVQPRVTNHPDLADLSNGGFISLRIVTAVNESGEVEVMYASLKLPKGNAINDNISTGALCSAVDLESGTAGQGHTVGMVNEAYDQHPDTGATITGREVPDWPKPLQLACDGHRAVLARQQENAERPNLFLGWDIGLAENGPIIIETNMFFADLYQCAGNGPVGETRFTELLCHHLDRLEAEYGPI